MNNDLISRGKLKKHYAWWRETENGRKMADLFDEIVDAQPTAEVVERKKGKWLVIEDEQWKGGGRYECSVCEYGFAFGAFHEMDEQHYCPNCGAEMEGTP